MKDILILNLARKLAIPLLAAVGGFIAGQYPNEFAALCGVL